MVGDDGIADQDKGGKVFFGNNDFEYFSIEDNCEDERDPEPQTGTFATACL